MRRHLLRVEGTFIGIAKDAAGAVIAADNHETLVIGIVEDVERRRVGLFIQRFHLLGYWQIDSGIIPEKLIGYSLCFLR